MAESLVLQVGKDFMPDRNDNIHDSLFQQYEKVIFQSIITSFGLDAFIKDQRGGDVDTIHNVRNGVEYKNAANAAAYKERPDYDTYAYHGGNAAYRQTKHDARAQAGETTGTIIDEYTRKPIAFGKSAPPQLKASLDHVIAAKTIHDDPGRVLAGLNGADLANSPENLKFTNQSLNSSMKAEDIPNFIAEHPELSEKTKTELMEKYNESLKSYNRKLAQAYYTSPGFVKATASAAMKTGAKMGVREALGFVMTEVWFAIKEEFDNFTGTFDLGGFLTAIGNGIKRGFKRAQEKYKELLAKFKEGLAAGALSSLTTTLCNIFFTTAKNVGRIIRQTWASLVQAAKVLFINPDNLLFGDRVRGVAKILATGASIVVGTLVSEAMEKTGIGSIPVVGEIIQVFCGSFVTGIMTCTLLHFFDRSEMINQLVTVLNKLPTMSYVVDYYRQQAEYFERYAAELMNIDVDKFSKEIAVFDEFIPKMENADAGELSKILQEAHERIGIKIPWGDSFDSFDSFMKSKEKALVFE